MCLTRPLQATKCRSKFPVFEKIVSHVVQREKFEEGVLLNDVTNVIVVT